MLWLAFKTIINLQVNTQGNSFMYLLCKCLFKDFLCSGWTGAARQQSKTYYSWEAATLPWYCSERVSICLSLWGLCIKAFLSNDTRMLFYSSFSLRARIFPPICDHHDKASFVSANSFRGEVKLKWRSWPSPILAPAKECLPLLCNVGRNWFKPVTPREENQRTQ